MITQSEFLRRLASYTHFSLADLANRSHFLRGAGKLQQGGRGLSAPKIEADECAWIILAAMSGASASECPKITQQLSDDMPLMNADGSKHEEVSIQESVSVSVPLDVVSTIAEILDDPSKADKLKSFALDHVNRRAVLSWVDGREDVFGQTDDFNSGAITFIHGRVFRLLALAIMRRERGSKAHLEWVKQVVKIGREQGEAAAELWAREHPFGDNETE